MGVAEAAPSALSPAIRSQRWPVRFDRGPNARAKIGFVLIPNEQTIEHEVLRLAPDGVGLYFSRATMPHEISTGSLACLANSLAETAGRILPDDGLDVICFACTSGAVAVGEARAITELQRGAPDARATTLATSVTRALRHLEARKIVVGTPYADELNDTIARFLAEAGFEIVAFEGLGLDYDRDMIRVAPDFLVEFAQAVDRPEAEAVLISCGALRTLEVVEEIERKLAKPVVCSNQAMIWDCLRLAGVDDRIEGYGRLLRDL